MLRLLSLFICVLFMWDYSRCMWPSNVNMESYILCQLYPKHNNLPIDNFRETPFDSKSICFINSYQRDIFYFLILFKNRRSSVLSYDYPFLWVFGTKSFVVSIWVYKYLTYSLLHICPHTKFEESSKLTHKEYSFINSSLISKFYCITKSPTEPLTYFHYNSCC